MVNKPSVLMIYTNSKSELTLTLFSLGHLISENGIVFDCSFIFSPLKNPVSPIPNILEFKDGTSRGATLLRLKLKVPLSGNNEIVTNLVSELRCRHSLFYFTVQLP